MMDSAVVITTKDRVNYLARAVESVFSQSLLPTELIIIDDFSTEHLPDELLNSFNKQALQLKIKFEYIYNIQPKGGNFSRNLGINKTSTPIVHFLDDDDFWLENKIEKQIEIFESNQEIGLVFTGKCFVQDTNLNHIKRKSKHKKSEDSIWCGNYVGSTSGVAVKREFLVKTNGFDDRLQSLQDYDLWIRVLDLTSGIWDGQYNLLYTVHSNPNKHITGNINKHLDTVSFLRVKYKEKLSSISLKEKNAFESRLEHVLARAYRGQGNLRFIKHLLTSLYLYPSIRTFALLFNIK